MSGNQYIEDPRQALFFKNYLDPKSKTFSSAYQSALAAGYSEEYAKVILSKDLDWLSENVTSARLVAKAEKNLESFLDDVSEKRIQADITKFVAERLYKKKYAIRQELTGEDGGAITIDLKKATDEELQSLLQGGGA